MRVRARNRPAIAPGWVPDSAAPDAADHLGRASPPARDRRRRFRPRGCGIRAAAPAPRQNSRAIPRHVRARATRRRTHRALPGNLDRVWWRRPCGPPRHSHVPARASGRIPSDAPAATSDSCSTPHHSHRPTSPPSRAHAGTRRSQGARPAQPRAPAALPSHGPPPRTLARVERRSSRRSDSFARRARGRQSFPAGVQAAPGCRRFAATARSQTAAARARAGRS